MSNSTKKIHNIAFVIYSGADILDFCGPLEILSGASHTKSLYNPDFAFNTTLIARGRTIGASTRGCMTVSADATIEEASKRIDDFDILVVPGGNKPLVLELGQKGGPEVEFIRAFNALPPKTDGDERILFSVCTGALLVAAAGALKGLRATTHHLSLEAMKGIDGSIDVVSPVGGDGVERYVDCGRNREGMRVVTAGGVSCGLDAALFVVELKVGREAAEFVAETAEYSWNRVEK